ncbi:DUF805 domain-containing protein [Parashewanella spongiae]|uniref:DUF805 domain-containing protein n=1 Tax=Parashewanella spongiae TaxID=342950 RepID=A0A3A6TWM2_9GAMM|nr:DUF805 domain-containing protein [Parashewanella spongiae]MCL1080017.1 DUF805 domain-containing protein [Parashewanella spongiae]RJY05853.1 DUF805 domain-containing protein [Parashewanella spongiae]
MDHFIGCLKKYADFTGRARRQEYWMYALVYVVLYVVIGIVDSILGSTILSIVFSLGLLLPSIAVAARRLHDTGRSGWWQLLGLIPIIGWIVLLIFYVQDSHEDNEYGSNPKSVG